MNRIAIATLMTSAVALAQGPGGPPPGRFGEMHVMGMSGMRPGQVVSGAPFSGQEVTTETQTLANGTHITNTISTQLYRDTTGRTRVERTFSRLGASTTSAQPTTMIDIFDPVGGARYFLNPSKLSAVKETVSTTPRAERQRPPHTGSGQVTTTSLGSQTIQGLAVTGTMTTRVIPAGQMGNDQAITITDEKWYSADLQMAVLTKHVDPRSGETDFAMQNISRTAPDASLFAPPSNYTVTTRAAGHQRGGLEVQPPPPATEQ